MPDNSSKVVYTALAGNVAIAIAKLVAFALSGSSAMLTEGIHSCVDSVDQVLLLVGQSRARKRRDGTHPLGYGMETYFWSFIVALIVFGLGGIASIYEGVHRVMNPEPTGSVVMNLSVLAIAAVFEGLSFSVAFREYKRMVGGRAIPLWTFIKASKDPNLYATLLEDGAALVGIVIATCGVVASTVFDVRWADGGASIAIGALLVGVSSVLANETRSLIAGEAVAPPILEKLKHALAAESRIERVQELATLHLGPKVIMVALTATFRRDMDIPEFDDCVRDLSRALKAEDERVVYVYVRPAGSDPLT